MPKRSNVPEYISPSLVLRQPEYSTLSRIWHGKRKALLEVCSVGLVVCFHAVQYDADDLERRSQTGMELILS